MLFRTIDSILLMYTPLESSRGAQVKSLGGIGSRAQVWPFHFCGAVSTVDGSLHGGDGAVVDECRYDWGTVENHGWQGHGERVR